jgi:hypothetical protein
VSIKAATYYGARHGLETLSQLISLDELAFTLQMHAAAQVFKVISTLAKSSLFGASYSIRCS